MKFTDRALPLLADMEFRELGDGTHFTGYAALFDSPTDPRFLTAFGYTETVAPGAFKRSLGTKQSHAFVVNHDPSFPLASTKSGRLALSEDSRGLLVEAELPNTSYANDLRALHGVGETRGMSFTFRPARGGEQWTGNARRLTDLALGHVTILTNDDPAYPATAKTMQLRSLAADLDADLDDLDSLVAALVEGRQLTETEHALLLRFAEHRAPTPAVPEEPAGPVGRSLAEARAALEARGIK